MIKTNSCSSKVLIAGGYSILFEGNKGLVLSTSACYTSTSEITPIDQSNNQLLGKVEIESKGFNTKWLYNISLNNDSKHLIIEPEDKQASKNVFLDAVLRTGLSFSYNQLTAQPFNLKISISNDNAFYSIEEHQGKTVFKKSGLGSSACLITTVLASILDSFNSISRIDKKDLGILHILCQVANSLAQNKIGSGFDISAAIFGNQVYSRFPVKEVETLVDALGNDKDSSNFNELALNTLKDSAFEWLIPSQLIFPQSLKLWLIDLETGSDTRSLVKEILKYLDSSPQWKAHFFEVANKVVQGMYDIFQEIDSFEKQGEADTEKLAPLYEKLKSLSTEYRKLLKDLGNNAKVEVEPDLLTYVLDQLTSLNKDIIYAVCPGAGGYDAACLISTQDLSQEDLDKALQKVNSDIKEKGLFPSFADLKLKILPIQSYPDANIKFY